MIIMNNPSSSNHQPITQRPRSRSCHQLMSGQRQGIYKLHPLLQDSQCLLQASQSDGAINKPNITIQTRKAPIAQIEDDFLSDNDEEFRRRTQSTGTIGTSILKRDNMLRKLAILRRKHRAKHASFHEDVEIFYYNKDGGFALSPLIRHESLDSMDMHHQEHQHLSPYGYLVKDNGLKSGNQASSHHHNHHHHNHHHTHPEHHKHGGSGGRISLDDTFFSLQRLHLE